MINFNRYRIIPSIKIGRLSNSRLNNKTLIHFGKCGFDYFSLLAGIVFVVFLFAGSKAQAITGANPGFHPPVDVLPLPIAHKINLEQAINMILKTELGQQFKTDIAELAKQGKIRLTALNDLHYGESGEGCIIRDGQYYYEGLFIVLNEKQTISELASSLIHETDHYRQIKRLNREKPATPVTIGWLEISAFAIQLDFIQELEKLGMANRKAMFLNGQEIIFDIMTTARTARDNPSEQNNTLPLQKMVEFGYPSQELQRNLLTKDPENCQGKVF